MNNPGNKDIDTHGRSEEAQRVAKTLTVQPCMGVRLFLSLFLSLSGVLLQFPLNNAVV